MATRNFFTPAKPDQGKVSTPGGCLKSPSLRVRGRDRDENRQVNGMLSNLDCCGIAKTCYLAGMIYAVGIRQEVAGAARAGRGPRLTSAATGLRVFVVRFRCPEASSALVKPSPPTQGLWRTRQTQSNLVKPSPTLNFPGAGRTKPGVTRAATGPCDPYISVVRGRRGSPGGSPSRRLRALRAFVVRIRCPEAKPGQTQSSLVAPSPTFNFQTGTPFTREICVIRGFPNSAQPPFAKTTADEYGLIRPNTALNSFTGHGSASIQRFTGAPPRRKLSGNDGEGIPEAGDGGQERFS